LHISHKKASYFLKTSFWVLTLIPAIFSCVELYDPSIKTTKQRLVVESHLSTRDEYQYVFLTYDAGYNGEESNFKFLVKKAKVTIEDDRGSTYEFIDDLSQNSQINTAEGYNYRSIEKFKASVGRSYKLKIETLNGNKYESASEKVLPVPIINKIHSEYKSNPAPSKVVGNFNVYVDVKDPADAENYYMWRSYSVKQLNYCREWYIYAKDEIDVVAFIDKCCQTCYEKEICEDCFELNTDKFTNGKTIAKQYVTQAPYLDTKPYYVVISQYSLSPAAYKYWNAVMQQSKNSGGLFDATPQSFQGNIKSKTDLNEEVLGYFTVSDVNDHIDRNLKSPKPNQIEEYSDFWKRTEKCYPCEESYKRTKTAPPGWIF
jgi:Domain of unknown function (DUF4249)